MADLELKPIKDFQNLHFWVKNYQRGYKWTKEEVTQLLNDIYEFEPQNENEFYCLQPIVIKEDSGKKELIDGQQRCTTIYLILKYLGKDTFLLDYQTRKESETFIKEIDSLAIAGEWKDWVEAHPDKDNVDNYHFFEAYRAIQDWFAEESRDKKRFLDKLLNKTQVIWYEVEGNIDSIELFTRINSHKIPLTEAELIKALFLINLKKGTKQSEVLQLQQNEIAQQWDRIENELQNKNFWYFISHTAPGATRIDKLLSLSTIFKNPDKIGEHALFFAFEKDFKDSQKEASQWVTNRWGEIKHIFQTFKEWYHDFELYHLIGLLIHLGEDIDDILSVKEKSTSKKDFKNHIKEKIYKKIEEIGDIRKVSYSESRDKAKRTLLIFNIISILNSKDEVNRFPFYQYQNIDWDIEHIHAKADNTKEQKKWLEEFKEWLLQSRNNELIEKYSAQIDEALAVEKKDNKEEDLKEEEDKIGTLIEDIYDYFSNTKEEGEAFDIDNLSNLALLDSSTNRGYGKAPFPQKRTTIIKRDEEGVFIPLCTRNVFLKYYSPHTNSLLFWSATDRKNYLDKIEETLKNFKSYE
ncbi:DUF262 domain-containing protein [Capnocytophaga gingivalis]|jgi:hypothetical protein|uniref:DUF262 domain-containing protein n=1 Tax=Capnocytophaga gingivalis TaxID=1017 RepID=A0ABU5Y597_9FLAO|nr:DUF262 domain-containing protein [Capnocytophaga gingivalis]MEB3014072.1 DUF262 domain-containing protein [Capnocytophaga gingivalis]MEB3039107.1 DUF262 domain-containing protein [Capnocytophaga gingivalis]